MGATTTVDKEGKASSRRARHSSGKNEQKNGRTHTFLAPTIRKARGTGLPEVAKLKQSRVADKTVQEEQDKQHLDKEKKSDTMKSYLVM